MNTLNDLSNKSKSISDAQKDLYDFFVSMDIMLTKNERKSLKAKIATFTKNVMIETAQAMSHAAIDLSNMVLFEVEKNEI